MRYTLDNNANNAVLPAILLIIFLLIGAATASIVMNSSKTTTETDLNTIVNTIVDDLTTYPQIKDIVGKFTKINGEQKITKLAILVKPLVQANIDVSTLSIEICNGNYLRILPYSGQVARLSSYSLFEHPLWDNTTSENFSLVVILDTDDSLTQCHAFDHETDTAFFIIQLPDEFALQKDDSLTLTLFPSSGASRTMTLVAPLPIQRIVSLL